MSDEQREIAELKARLAKLENRNSGTRPATSPKPDQGGGVRAGVILLLLVVGGLFVIIITNQEPKAPEPTYSERVKAACNNEFGEGVAANDCAIKAMTKELYRQQADRQASAERAAR